MSLSKIKAVLLANFLFCTTWPYAVSLEGYTLGPLREILEEVDDHDALERKVIAFLRGKDYEFRLVYLGVCRLPLSSLLCTTDSHIQAALGVAATVGVFSWDSIYQTTWFAHACWFTALTFAVFSNFSANQLSPIVYGMTLTSHKGDEVELRDGLRALSLIGLRRCADGDVDEDVEAQKKFPLRMSRAMLYVWQGPMMLMGWSWAIFMFGLVVHETSPLRHDHDTGNNVKSASFVLCVHCLLACNFVGTSMYLKAARKQADAHTLGHVKCFAVKVSTKDGGGTSLPASIHHLE